MQARRDTLNKIDLELDDQVLDQMALPLLKDQIRRLKDDLVWDDAHKKIVPILGKVVLGKDIAAKYGTDYAAERSRYLAIIGIANAYRCSDGVDVGMVNLTQPKKRQLPYTAHYTT